jgi:hypothetical protein
MSIARFAAMALAFAVSAALGPGRAAAEEPLEGSCVYNREVHPPRSEICQGDTLKRCENGAWVDVGHCDQPALQPPRAEGGDELKPPPTTPKPR